MVIKVQNFVNGAFIESAKYIDVHDYTGKHVLAQVPDADGGEIRKIRRAILLMQEDIAKTSLDERIQILKKILKEYLQDKHMVEAIAQLRGTPVKQIQAPLQKLMFWIDHIDAFFDVVYAGKKQFLEGKNVLFEGKAIGKTVYRTNQPTFIGLSGNMDGFEQFFVLAQGVLAGSHMIVRASSRDFVTYEFFRLMHKHGYGQGGQLITWDSKKPESTAMLRLLLESASHAIMFGSNKTINEIIYEKNEKGEIVKDYSLLVDIHRYGSGLPVVIVTEHANIQETAKHIIEGAIDARGAHCISTTPVFVHKDIREAFIKEIKLQLKQYKHEQPTHPEADFGGYSKKELENVEQFIAEINQHAEHVEGKVRKEDHTMDLIVFDNVKEQSKLLREEIMGTVLGIIPYEDLHEVVRSANAVLPERGLKKHLLTVVHGSQEEWMLVKKNLHSHLVRWNVNSADLEPFLPHQGSYFILDMTEITN